MTAKQTQIEHEAESHRAHISQLVEELRERATPGEVLDQFLGWDEGREIALTFGRQIRDNPLPLALVGTGVAWLILSDGRRGRKAARTYANEAASRSDLTDVPRRVAATAARASNGASDAVRNAGEWTRDAVAGATGAVSDAYGSAVGTASDLADGAQSALARTRQSMSGAAAGVGESASNAWGKTSAMAQNAVQGVRQAGSGLNSLSREQPLVAAGLGLALGMLLGAVLPVSETENDMFGQQGDALRDRAGELAGEGYRKAKSVVQHTYEAAAEAARDEVKKQGPASDDSQGASADGAAPQEGAINGGGYASSTYSHH